jgi:hypothetical protein
VVGFGGVMDFAAALFSWWIATGYSYKLKGHSPIFIGEWLVHIKRMNPFKPLKV